MRDESNTPSEPRFLVAYNPAAPVTDTQAFDAVCDWIDDDIEEGDVTVIASSNVPEDRYLIFNVGLITTLPEKHPLFVDGAW